MTKRIHEPVEVLHRRDELGEVVPRAFRWRGRRYAITAVLGHWREDAAWWSGPGLSVPQRDLWRVEARRGHPAGASDTAARDVAPRPRRADGDTAAGVYELACDPEGWRLDRVWD
jgi:hypothetical protein